MNCTWRSSKCYVSYLHLSTKYGLSGYQNNVYLFFWSDFFFFFFVQNVSFSWLHFNFQFLQILFKNFKNFSQSVDVNVIDPAKDFLVEEVKE